MIGALYIHIPFCEKKCYYCDFVSFPQCSEDIKIQYIEALEKEAILAKAELELDLHSIFIGGGTPTCLSGGLLVRLLALKEYYKLQDTVEISIEANPGTISKEKLKLLRANGVNRLSLGVQSFKQSELTKLGRIHSVEEIEQSFLWAREAGFTNINIDLMYGLPGQNIKDWQTNLEKVLTLDPEHISLYQLKIEEGTPFADQLRKGMLKEFSDELASEMYVLAKDYLSFAGFEHYEISNYAKPGFRSIHNQSYWLSTNYLGLGAGAHSFISPWRQFNYGELKNYITYLKQGQKPPYEQEMLTASILMSEFMFMGLRLIEGVNLLRFADRFGVDAREVFKSPIAKCLKLGLVEIINNNIRLTEKGILLGNLVFEEFLLSENY